MDKANVLETSRLWRKTVTAYVAEFFPEIQLEHILVDAAAMFLIRRHADFDVILTENMFGDILSDEASVITGSLGLLPSASVGIHTSVFEPIHGSYPQAAGKDIANPIATVLSAAMLLELSLNLTNEAQAIRDVVDKSMTEGIVTEDIAERKSYKTSEVGDWLAGNL